VAFEQEAVAGVVAQVVGGGLEFGALGGVDRRLVTYKSVVLTQSYISIHALRIIFV